MSVIIPVRNGERYIAMCLQALAASDSGPVAFPVDIIVVDDGSRDASARVAREHGVQVLELAVSQGAAAARNAGAAAARQPLLMFLDADVLVHADTLQRAHRAMTARDAPGAVFGAYDDMPLAPGVVSQYRNLLHHFTHSTGERRAGTFWAGCGIIRRDLFLQHAGFDERYLNATVEDIELGSRLSRSGVQIRLIPEIQVCHAKSWTLATLVRTDMISRAWPWSWLLLRSGSLPDDLNLRRGQRVSAVLAWLAVALAAAAPVFPAALPGACAAAAGVAFCNRRFLGFLVRKRGVGFAARAFPLHLLYFLYSSATFAAVAVLFTAGKTRGTAGGSAVAPSHFDGK